MTSGNTAVSLAFRLVGPHPRKRTTCFTISPSRPTRSQICFGRRRSFPRLSRLARNTHTVQVHIRSRFRDCEDKTAQRSAICFAISPIRSFSRSSPRQGFRPLTRDPLLGTVIATTRPGSAGMRSQAGVRDREPVPRSPQLCWTGADSGMRGPFVSAARARS